MKVRWFVLVPALALALGGTLVGPPAASGAPQTPTPAAEVRPGPVFNTPTGGADEQYRIRDHVVELIDGAPEGSTFTFSLYHLTTDEKFVDSIEAARDRGVKIRAVIEAKFAEDGSTPRLREVLGTDQSKPTWGVVCTDGCIGDRINHNKFYAFSETGGSERVVVQSSANVTSGNAEKFWNNAVTFVGNEKLYDGYLDYFDDLAAQKTDMDYYRTVDAGAVKAYFFPRAGSGASTDTIVNVLGNVACTGNSEVGTDDGRTIIRIGMWFVGRQAVADKLAELGGQGCQVDVVYTEGYDEPIGTLEGAENVTVRHLPDSGETIVHSKYMLVEGAYADTTDAKITFTGSHNFSDASLRRNDETLLKITDDAIHDGYRDNFADVYAAAG